MGAAQTCSSGRRAGKAGPPETCRSPRAKPRRQEVPGEVPARRFLRAGRGRAQKGISSSMKVGFSASDAGLPRLRKSIVSAMISQP